MLPLEIRVLPRGLAWHVVCAAWREERIDTLCTRERAVEHALERAAELRRTEQRPILIRVEDGARLVETLHAA